MLLAIFLTTVAFAAGIGSSPPPKPISGLAPPAPDHEVLRQGGDTIADALPIAGLPFAATGTTTGYTNDYDEVCPYGSSVAPDVVYALTPSSNLTATFDLCGSSFDTKLYLYDQDLNLVACNDDTYYGPPCGMYVSKLEEVPLAAGVAYFLVIDGYGNEHGQYDLEVVEDIPCQLPLPPDSLPEGEPPLVNDYVDAHNGGCNSAGLPMQVLPGDANGELVVCGRAGFYLFDGSNYRDTDWFILVVGDAGVIEVHGDAERPTRLYDMGYQDCGIPEWTQDITVGACSPASMVMLGAPGGSMWFVVLPATFASPSGEYPYEYDYVVHFAGLQTTVTTENSSWSKIKALFD